MAMTRARWLLGGVLAAAALAVGLRSLATYISGGLIVGVAAVSVLIAILAVGLASLARARRQLGRELLDLNSAAPSGPLYAGRRGKLEALRARDAVPDLDALADTTAADEAERAFAGKYLVATTVLVGLVGTFGGLMETLGRLPPLLNADGVGTLALLTGPLAGLHVTFGASVVAILVTLALSLVQGDVALHQERVLALLEERTRHVLVPALWPPAEGAQERTARALSALRAEIAATLSAGVAAAAKQVTAALRTEVQRLVDDVGVAWRANAAAQTEAMKRLTDEIGSSARAATTAQSTATTALAEEIGTSWRANAAAQAETMKALAGEIAQSVGRLTEASARQLGEAAASSTAALSGSATSVSEALRASDSRAREESQRVARVVEEAAAAHAESSRASLAQLTAALREQQGEVSTALREQQGEVSAALREQLSSALAATAAQTSALQSAVAQELRQVVQRLDAGAEALAAVSTRASEGIEGASASVLSRLGDVGSDVTQRLEGATRALSGAADALRGAVDGLAPAVTRLAPELAALSHEVALLATRAETEEQPNVVLDELIRLGEDVERLIDLAQPPAASEEDRA